MKADQAKKLLRGRKLTLKATVVRTFFNKPSMLDDRGLEAWKFPVRPDQYNCHRV